MTSIFIFISHIIKAMDFSSWFAVEHAESTKATKGEENV